MSYDLAVWEGERPEDATTAGQVFADLYDRYISGERQPPAAPISEYVNTLLERWCDMTGDEEEDGNSPWSTGPLIRSASGPLVYFAMRYSMAQEASAYAANLAASMGLVCFDPQLNELWPPDHRIDDRTIDQLTAAAELDGIATLAVGAVITDEAGRVLLLRRNADDFMGGQWELPSGKVDAGERLDAALAREVNEETGLDLTAVTAHLGYFDYANRRGGRSRQHNFAIATSATAPVVLTEHDAYAWRELADDLPVSDAVKAVLAAASRTAARP
jgi:8-oxo-dGTP diphosphatase